MRRESGLSLRGALAILGHYESGVIGKLDKILGGVILAAGVGAGLAAVASPALAPLAVFAALWGWTEQKNQAVELLRQAIAGVPQKVLGTAGAERRQLIAAAHTTIVVAAFFESFREHLSAELYKEIALTDEEKLRLVGLKETVGRLIFEHLYGLEVPAPSPARGFEENVGKVTGWYWALTEYFVVFLRGLSATRDKEFRWKAVIDGAIERYRSHYLAVAATVPEFCVWAMLGEHAATRTAIANLNEEVAGALAAQSGALSRVEALLALEATRLTPPVDQCAVIERANRGVLDQPIVPADAERYGAQVVFPPIGEIYINPRYRVGQASQEFRPASESWWEEQVSHSDIDLMLAGHVTSPYATELPLLLLGHPGAGKSLLTKVLAARLAASGYTVVRVPLRQVNANAPIISQIQQALDLSTNLRVRWPELSEQSRDRIRVVLLDGLDELLQASTGDRSGYLLEVADFQRIEADQGQPIVIVVTSRTVVADRVDIPLNTSVAKLDFFDERDIEDWLRIWHGANPALTGRELTPAAALRHPDLARQPLLLLMLALYSANPAFPALEATLSTADLYDRLLDNFARREVAKKAKAHPSAAELEDGVRTQLERLSVAALAMFNRGQQDITEIQLGRDLAALKGSTERASATEAGQRIIAEFFFVHAAEARLTEVPGRDAPLRSYEFLHSTFGEYLVAWRVMNELCGVAETALGGRFGTREPDDDLLFALLSHQPFVVRASTLTFATEVFDRLTETERERVLEVLNALIKSHRSRHGSDRYAAYRPTPLDRIRELAAYSANLVTLRLALQPDHSQVSLRSILSETGDLLGQWRSMVAAWRSGLDIDGQQALASYLQFSDLSLRFGTSTPVRVGSADALEIQFAALAGHEALYRQLQLGMAICDRTLYSGGAIDNWTNFTVSWLLQMLLGIETLEFDGNPPADLPADQAATVGLLVTQVLNSRRLGEDTTIRLLRLLFSLPRTFQLDTHMLAAIVMRRPLFAEYFLELADPTIYGDDYQILRLSGAAEKIRPAESAPAQPDALANWLQANDESSLQQRELRAVVLKLLDHYSRRLSFWEGIDSKHL